MGKKREDHLVLTQREYRFFQALAKSGRASQDLTAEHYNIKYKRLQKLVQCGYLKKEPMVWQEKATYCYRLTSQGQRWVKNNIATVNHLYKCSTKGTTHDVQLFKLFSELTNYEQDIALTENDIVARYGKIKGTSPPDLMVPSYEITKGGITRIVKSQIYEVTTRTYTTKDKEAKAEYVEIQMRIGKEAIHYEEAS